MFYFVGPKMSLIDWLIDIDFHIFMSLNLEYAF